MAGQKRSFLIVLGILGAVAAFLGLVMAVALTFLSPSSDLPFGNKIGIIPIEGKITDARPVLEQLVRFRKDDKIKAIVLRIDSPGGQVGPSQEIYREVRKTIQTKKVVASMGNLAASGGYYIAAAANRIVANPGTITGSIGVVMEFVQLQELMKKIGVSLEILTSGEFKDIGSPLRDMTPKERELLNRLIKDVQQQFVSDVAEGRNLAVEKVRGIADGRIFSGAQAKELGLVDLLGNFRDAVDLAKTMAGITGDVALIYPERERLRLWDIILSGAAEALKAADIGRTETRIEYRWKGF